jgi:hypothetical protein
MSYAEELDKQLIDWKTSLRTEEFPAFYFTVPKIASYPTGGVLSVFFLCPLYLYPYSKPANHHPRLLQALWQL